MQVHPRRRWAGRRRPTSRPGRRRRLPGVLRPLTVVLLVTSGVLGPARRAPPPPGVVSSTTRSSSSAPPGSSSRCSCSSSWACQASAIGNGTERATFIAYLFTVLLVIPATIVVAVKEKTQWAMGVVLGAPRRRDTSSPVCSRSRASMPEPQRQSPPDSQPEGRTTSRSTSPRTPGTASVVSSSRSTVSSRSPPRGARSCRSASTSTGPRCPTSSRRSRPSSTSSRRSGSHGVTGRRCASPPSPCPSSCVGVLVVRDCLGAQTAAFPDKTVWSHFGQGYGFVPLLLPLVGLWWIRRTARASAASAAEVAQSAD